ncbi:hypothetical protein SCHPADRAFT_381861 [Schizopora paradoxa]|uniref:Uncharacterized protein n=1 Tax=Schizopora paradoxa TaxID=27342 RepID=A0A0H2RN94_9AGAM|nr:hypothetical protein SCHPADRAFT_381861 [Schizopora paradoxa]
MYCESQLVRRFRNIFLLHIPFFILLLNAPQTSSSLVNVSIDDSSSDPFTGGRIMYGKTNDLTIGDGWNAINLNQNCSNCAAQPSLAQVFGQTYHESSIALNGENIGFALFSFTGVAIYVMGIIVTNTPATTASLNGSRIFFQVDGVDQGSFIFDASLGPKTTYSYNTTLFAKEDLLNGPHNVTMMCGDGNTSRDAVCLLDRFIYTSVDSSVTSSLTEAAVPTDTLTASLSSPSEHVSIVSAILIISAVIFVTMLVTLGFSFYIQRRWFNRLRDSTPRQDEHVRAVTLNGMTYSGPDEVAMDTLDNRALNPHHEPPSYTYIANGDSQLD